MSKNRDTLRSNPRSPGTHIVGPWVTDSIELYRDLRTGTQCITNWASRERGVCELGLKDDYHYLLLVADCWL